MRNRRNIILLIEVLLFIFLIYTSYKIYSYYKDLKEIDLVSENIQDIVINSEKKDINGDNDESTLKNIQESYPNAVGYIDIPGTNISYPIAQGSDNTFYINHSIDNTYNGNGSIFLDYRNNSNFSDDNNILYGHFIKSGKLFYDLDKFREQSFYDEYNKVFLYTDSKKYEYQIYSVYVTDPNTPYRIQNFNSYEDKLEFINLVKSKSIINTINLDLNISNQNILTLSTCSDKGCNRLVVHALKI